jgi:hypothetical protein
MPRRSSKKGADPSSRLGDLTPRKPHYQTGGGGAVNGPKAPIAPSDNGNKTVKESRRRRPV